MLQRSLCSEKNVSPRLVAKVSRYETSEVGTVGDKWRLGSGRHCYSS
jgi:hypothetical protein